MQPGIFVEMLTLEMGMCGGLSSGSAGQLLLPGGLGEGFPEKRLALSLAQGFRQLRTALPPGQEHKRSWDRGVPGVFGGWLGGWGVGGQRCDQTVQRGAWARGAS